MTLIKNGEIVTDPWVRLDDDDAPLPEDRPAFITVKRWQRDREALAGRTAPLGIVLDSNEPPSLIADDLARFEAVALRFPKFNDGRAFSYACLLRDRYGFKGEVRAVGHILRDQLLFLQRAGVDAMEVAAPDARAKADWRKALAEISVYYQSTHDGRTSVFRLRHQA
ncbi:MAG: DUF934 domain-containing protein [Rhodospirillales bacterium]